MAAPDGDGRAYDDRLMRLSEILGAVHYLRELCEGKDGMRWRNAVNDLIKTEGTTALRRATIARRFNLGYRSYRRTYRKCTPSAKNTIERFFKEAIEISDGLVKLGQ
ncbi:MAG: TIGR02301 family protein [Hyphomicrobiaceae bacterium]